MADTHISFDVIHQQPLLIVLSGPSGVGKDAALQEMKRRGLRCHFVVTTTSRGIRPGEVEGVDYCFVTRERFEEMIAEDAFVEYALVYQDYKGIPKAQIRRAMESGMDVVLRIDVQGAATVRKLCPEALLIFLTPANEAEWLQRLRERKTETEESLRLRIATASEELRCVDSFDYVVVNSDGQLAAAVDTIEAVITAEHHRTKHRTVSI